MSGVTYNVDVIYNAKGNLNAPLGAVNGLHARIGTLSTGLLQAGDHVSRLGDGFLGLAGKALAVVSVGALIGGAFAVVKEGLLDINATIEEAKISLASVFLAGGETKTFTESLDVSGKIIAEMRKDAAALPGTFADLSRIMQTIATPGMQSGMDAGQLEKFAAKTMAVGEILQVSSAMAGREMAHLLGPGGHLTKQNVFGQRLLGGIDTKEFNSKSTAEKLELITAGLDKHKAGIAAFEGSFKGLSTTFGDQIKLFAGASTAGLFERVKESLERGNRWFVDNKEQLASWAKTIGEGLVSAFEKAKVFAMNMTTYVLGLWEQIGPKIQSIAGLLGNFLTDANGPSKLITGISEALALALALKATGAGLQMAGTGMKIASGLGLPAIEAGPVGALVAATALVSLASAAAVVAGEMHALADETSAYHVQATTALNDLTNELSKFSISLGGVNTVWTVFESLGVTVTSTIAHLIGCFNDLIAPVQTLYAILAGGSIGDPAGAKAKYDYDHPAAKEPLALTALQLLGSENGGHDERNKKGQLVPPNHHTTIHKVEIVVNSNQDPSRIARLTMEQLVQVSRNRTGTSGSPNFSNRPLP